MSGHSKWHNIHVKKEAQDKRRGKIFTIHAKLIALTAQKGADPEKNPALAEAIDKARKDNVPTDNIERAIAKGAGTAKNAEQILEIVYEGYAPGGVGVVVKALTDNKNRTASNIRHLFSKHGGNLAETGSLTSFAFRLAGVCYLPTNKNKSAEELEEMLLESDAEDFCVEDDGFLKVTVERALLGQLVKYLKGKEVEIEDAGLVYLPTNSILIDDIEKGLKIYKLISDLEEDEDVEDVWSNYDMTDEMKDQVIATIEANTFSF